MREWPWQRPIPQGSGGGGSQTSTSKVELPAWLESAAQDTLANAQTVAGRDYQVNPAQTIVGPSADTTAAWDMIRNNVGSTGWGYDASAAALKGLLGGANPITAADVAGDASTLMNPYVGAVVDPAVALMRQQLGVTKGQIAGNAANVGAFGGSRQGVEEGVADAQQALQAGQLQGGLLQSGWNTALSTATGLRSTNLTAALQAAGLLPQVMAGEAGQQQKDAALLEAVGNAQTNQAQQEANLKAQQWQEQFDWPVTGLSIMESALAATPYGSTTTATQPVQGKSIAGGLLGGAAAGASIGSMIPGVGTGVGAGVGALVGLFG